MTYDEMKDVAEKVAAGLRGQGFEAVHIEPFNAGELPEIYCITQTQSDGEFALAVQVSPL